VDGNNDGYVDGELDYGTLATVPDSDGDGYDDGMEVRYGSDPMLDTDTPQDNHINNGDINGNGMVDVVDVLLATRMVLGQYQPVNDEEWIRADVVPDPQYPGQVNAGDLLRIQQLALGM
jgi:hypothetical protein